MKEKTKWSRYCPSCSNILYYSSKGNLKRADGSNSICNSCKKPTTKTKEKIRNTLTGRTRSLKERQNISKGLTGRKLSKIHIEKYRAIFLGEGNPFYGKTHTFESKRKMRLSMINELENKIGQSFPNYNPSSIPIIEAKAKELGITDLQHAENGGEFYIKELGYWVDGYSAEKNIVIEYDEKHHRKQIEKDQIRQTEITEYLNCEFIRIDEKEKVNFFG